MTRNDESDRKLWDSIVATGCLQLVILTDSLPHRRVLNVRLILEQITFSATDTFHITAEYTLNSNTNVATYVCWQLYGKIIIYYCYYYYYLIFTPVLERPRGLKANVKNRKMPESANRIYPQWVCGRRCLISIIYQIITKVNKLCTFFSLGMTRTKHFLNTGTSTNCTCKRFVSQQAIISSLTNGGSWALLRKSAVKSTKLVQPFYVNQAVGLGDLPRRLHAQFVAVRQFSHWQALPSFKKCQ